MKKLTKDEELLLSHLAKEEAVVINKSFELSNEVGLILLKNSITSFKQNYLMKTYGEVVLSMCSEYRVFILELLKNISEENKECVTKELLIPSLSDISDEDILKIFKIN